jgi:hypothetical protein
VDGRHVFRDLVYPESWIVLSHEARVGMAPSAHFRHLRRRGATDVAFRLVHGGRALDRWIAAVTSRTPELRVCVYVITESLDRLA